MVAAIPIPANAKLTSNEVGTARISQAELARPSAASTSRNVIAYSSPRLSAQVISPRATFSGPSGVDSAAS